MVDLTHRPKEKKKLTRIGEEAPGLRRLTHRVLDMINRAQSQEELNMINRTYNKIVNAYFKMLVSSIPKNIDKDTIDNK